MTERNKLDKGLQNSKNLRGTWFLTLLGQQNTPVQPKYKIFSAKGAVPHPATPQPQQVCAGCVNLLKNPDVLVASLGKNMIKKRVGGWRNTSLRTNIHPWPWVQMWQK